jgi:hypothetical protein
MLHGIIFEEIATWIARLPKSWWLNIKFVTLIYLSVLVLVFLIMAAGSSEMMVAFYQIIWHHIPKENNLLDIFNLILVYVTRLSVAQTVQG